jgi:GT2 family glycosyltransferase
VKHHFPNVPLLTSSVNGGFGWGNNRAADIAGGKYLVFINPDTVVEHGWFEQLIAVLEGDPQVGMVTPKILLLRNPDQINSCGNDIHISGLTLCRGLKHQCQAFSQMEDVIAVSGAAFAMRKDLFQAVGGFDEQFFMYMEDADLSWRVRLAGFRIVHVPDSIIWHDYHLNFGPLKTYLQERNRYLMLLKNLHWRTLIALLPILILAEVITWVFVLTCDRQHVMNKLKAYVWILTHWREICAIHHQNQAIRCCQDRELIATLSTDLAIEQLCSERLAFYFHIFFNPLFRVLKRLVLALI